MAFRPRGINDYSSEHSHGKAVSKLSNVSNAPTLPFGSNICLMVLLCCLQSRLKFMIRDVADLRQNRWQERRIKEGPKTIQEIHRDARQESRQAARLPGRRRDGPWRSGGGSRRGGFNHPPMGAHPAMHLQ